MANLTQPWYLRTPRQWQHLREVPWKRLWMFVLAVYFLFSVIGFFQDLMHQGTIPYAIVIMLAVVCGLNASLWIVVTARLPWPSVILLAAFQFALGPLMTVIAKWMGTAFALHSPASASGIRFAASGILAVVIASYALFISFFRVEGRETVRIRNELQLAHGIQKTLVPPITMCTDRFEVYGLSQPSDKVGGDLVDAVWLPNGDIVAYLADIAGHGLSAGILMGMLKTAAHTALLDAASGHPSESLPLLLEKLNRVLPDVKEPQMYATLTAFRLNADGSAWCAMAASPPVLHWSSQRRNLQLTQTAQFPLGLLPVSGFTGEPLHLAPGDLLVVATDGVLEVCNKQQEEFGIERLEKSIESHAHRPLAEMAEAILSGARAFGKQTDDQTLLIIRRVN